MTTGENCLYSIVFVYLFERTHVWMAMFYIQDYLSDVYAAHMGPYADSVERHSRFHAESHARFVCWAIYACVRLDLYSNMHAACGHNTHKRACSLVRLHCMHRARWDKTMVRWSDHAMQEEAIILLKMQFDICDRAIEAHHQTLWRAHTHMQRQRQRVIWNPRESPLTLHSYTLLCVVWMNDTEIYEEEIWSSKLRL